MYTIIAVVFCLLLGVMIRAQGITALLWTPIGFAFGLFVTAQMLLPLMLGIPRAVRLIAKREMRAAVLGRILVTPAIWFVLLAAVGFGTSLVWPSALVFLGNNAALNLGAWLGTVAIIFSPLSEKCRSNFRADFDKSYCRFRRGVGGIRSRDQYQEKEVGAVVTVASNLYLHTLQRAEIAPFSLQLSLPDSRYRYLVFCLSATEAACALDMTNSDVVVNGCLNFLVKWALENSREFFGGPVAPQIAINNGMTYLQEFRDAWSRYVELEKEGADNVDLICSMIHATESNVPAGRADAQRLGELALEIACRIPAMRDAFIELANQ